MPISNKFHRISSLVGGFITIGTVVFSVFLNVFLQIVSKINGTVSSPITVTFIITQLSLIVVAVALLLGKKNVVTGILLLVSAALELVFSGVNHISNFLQLIRLSGDLPQIILIRAALFSFASLFIVLWRILIAVECFKAGAISGNACRFVLILVPIVSMILQVAGTIILSMLPMETSNSATALAMMIPSAIGAFIPHLGPIIACISASIPVREAPPVYYYPPTPYRPY